MTSLPLETTLRPTWTSVPPTSGHDIRARACNPASTVESVTSRTVLDVLRQAFAAELNGHRIPDDELVAWLHDNHNIRGV